VRLRRSLLGIAAAFSAAMISVAVQGQTPAPAASGYITGVVQGARRPEAGVWVIRRNKGPTDQLHQIVVTDDRGRFMLPTSRRSYRVFCALWLGGFDASQLSPSATR